MKRLAGLAGAIALSLMLAGCGSASFSFSNGYHDGQTLAAEQPQGALVATRAAATATCRVDWVIAGSISVSKVPWLVGCMKGFEAVATEVGRP